MILRFVCLIATLTFSQVALSAACTMNPTPIDVKRIARNAAIKSYVVDEHALELTALLKNGRALRLVHMGCEHSGAWASLWFDTKLPFANKDAWKKEFINFSRIAFSPDVASDIIENLNSGNYKSKTSESRIEISESLTEFMNYTIVLSTTEQGVLLTITYSLG